jgi:hypothetical protein
MPSIAIGGNVDWITNRKPRRDELRVTFERGTYKHYSQIFLIWNGTQVVLDSFEMPPKGTDWYEGYWRYEGEKVIAWMPLPIPPGDTKK